MTDQLINVFSNGLLLSAKLILPISIAGCVGAFVMGIVKVGMQIHDDSLSLFGRVVGVMILLWFSMTMIGNSFITFATRLWGGADYFF